MKFDIHLIKIIALLLDPSYLPFTQTCILMNQKNDFLNHFFTVMILKIDNKAFPQDKWANTNEQNEGTLIAVLLLPRLRDLNPTHKPQFTVGGT